VQVHDVRPDASQTPHQPQRRQHGEAGQRFQDVELIDERANRRAHAANAPAQRDDRHHHGAPGKPLGHLRDEALHAASVQIEDDVGNPNRML